MKKFKKWFKRPQRSPITAWLCKWHGIDYFCDKLDGAPIKHGTRVKKVNSQEDDFHQDGNEGTVIGSFSIPIDHPELGTEHIYTVSWDSHKEIPVTIIGGKLESIT